MFYRKVALSVTLSDSMNINF